MHLYYPWMPPVEWVERKALKLHTQQVPPENLFAVAFFKWTLNTLFIDGCLDSQMKLVAGVVLLFAAKLAQWVECWTGNRRVRTPPMLSYPDLVQLASESSKCEGRSLVWHPGRCAYGSTPVCSLGKWDCLEWTGPMSTGKVFSPLSIMELYFTLLHMRCNIVQMFIPYIQWHKLLLPMLMTSSPLQCWACITSIHDMHKRITLKTLQNNLPSCFLDQLSQYSYYTLCFKSIPPCKQCAGNDTILLSMKCNRIIWVWP